MLIRFYCIAIRSSRMLYMIGIKEISSFDGIDLQATWGCNNACSIVLIIEHVEHTLYFSHSRDVPVNPTPEGAAALLTFVSIEDLSQYVLRLYPDLLFN